VGIRLWICRVYSSESGCILVVGQHSCRLIIIEGWRILPSFEIHVLLLHLGAANLKHRLLLLSILWRSLGLLSLLFLHLILVVLNCFHVELLLTLFWVASHILTCDAGKNISVILIQILLWILLAKFVSPAFRPTTFLVLWYFLVMFSESRVADVLVHLVLGTKIDTVHIIEVICRATQKIGFNPIFYRHVFPRHRHASWSQSSCTGHLFPWRYSLSSRDLPILKHRRFLLTAKEALCWWHILIQITLRSLFPTGVVYSESLARVA